MKRTILAALFLLGLAAPSTLLAAPPPCYSHCTPERRCCALCTDESFGFITTCDEYTSGACTPCARAVPESEKQQASLEEILGTADLVCAR